ncbi:isochorismate synthase [Cerasibacillus terrae]|uniref:Isochorismate synthase MenF n=1 Tax=Cerasibacillus terrae TaxID=2498845 RepID=A0A5C8NGS4_9BACI|nr:isochorismate synthase [Cerasibacillus terrae]TXL58161.1 isochorismate synthase [Cerasibacillus terrae]
MTDTRNLNLKEILTKAKEEGKKVNRQLVSYTRKINDFNPLAIFENGKELSQKKRMFWKRYDDQYIFVGIGNITEIVVENEGKQAIYNKWRRIVKEAIIYNPYQEAGVGLVAFGGIAFDPKKAPTPLWAKFAENEFRIPQFLFIKKKDSFYVTINMLINKDENIEECLKEYENIEKQLLGERTIHPTMGKIIDKQEINPEQWKQAIEDAKVNIQQKQTEKIVLARELRLHLSQSVDITSVLHTLIATQPNSYVFAYEQGTDCFVGATPEQLINVEGNQLQSMCVAGTAPRGRTDEEDERLNNELFHDKKNREEHDYVVQMIRQSIEPFCYKIDIPNTPTVYPLKNLQHLYTPVTAILKSGQHLFDLIDTLHPTPALGGTPKDTALAFIREHEHLDRGWYGAPIGWIDCHDNGEFAVAIRSALIQEKEASLFAGCGIVKDSDTQTEYEETKIKFLPMLSVLGGS